MSNQARPSSVPPPPSSEPSRALGFGTARDFLFRGLASLVPAAWGAVVLQAGYVAVCWLFLYFLSRHKVFLKV